MEESKIISLKAKPNQILNFLKIIKENENNINVIKDKLHEYLLKESLRGKREKRNSIYAISLPSLRKLDLIEGKGDKLRLNTNGNLLYDTFVNKGIIEYKKLFAKFIFFIDRDNCNTLDIFVNVGGEDITFEKLIEKLIEKKVNTSQKDDRIKRWIKYLEYVDFIEILKNNLKINKFQIQSISNKRKNVEKKLFSQILIEGYKKLKILNKGGAFIKIPSLRKKVCQNLQRFNFTTFDFDSYLENIWLRQKGKIGGYQIILSRPGAREGKGIKINNHYYYYISIH